jgi:predicted DNA-binding protein (MmcQ/YjbR family)
VSYPKQLESPEGRKLLAALRRVMKRLPDVAEVIDGFGHTTFKAGEKSFVIAGMGEAGTAISIKSDLVTQDALIRRGPFYRTPYIGQHGWISIDAPLSHDWSEVEELIADAYGLVGPKRAAKKKSAPEPGARSKKERAVARSKRKTARKKR